MKKSALRFLVPFLFLQVFQGYAQWSYVRLQLSGIEKQGELLWKKKAYASAIPVYRRVFEKDSTKSIAIQRLAECNRILRRSAQAEYWYKKLAVRTDGMPETKFAYAELLLQNGKVNDARDWYAKYLYERPDDSCAYRKWKALQNTSGFYEDSLCYTISGAAFNSPQSDAGTCIAGDSILFLSSRERNSVIQYRNASDSSFSTKLYSIQKNGKSSGAKRFTSISENTIPTVWDSCRKFVTEVTQHRKGMTYSVLYYGDILKSGKHWNRRHQLPFCHSGHSYKHPYFDEAGSALYFVSDRPGGAGGWDVYKSILSNGNWSEPISLGNTINTTRNEYYPYVSPDGTLYFSSNGHPGLGGLDVFSVELKSDPIQVVNIGHPVNSHQDDFAFTLTSDQKSGYLSSNRLNGGSDDDIYEVQLHKQAVEIRVLDLLRKMPQANAIVKISELKSGRTVRILKTNSQGTVSCFLKPGKRYSIEVIKENFRVYRSDYFSGTKDTVYPAQEILLEKVNKSFIRATIVSDSVRLKTLTIRALDYYSDQVHQVQSDASGQFYCEINPDTTNIFFIRENGMDKIFKLESIRKKRNALQSTGGNIHFEEVTRKPVAGILKDSNGVGSGADSLIVVNILNSEELRIVTDAQGKFKLELWTLGKYKVYILRNKERIYLRSFATEVEELWELETK